MRQPVRQRYSIPRVVCGLVLAFFLALVIQSVPNRCATAQVNRPNVMLETTSGNIIIQLAPDFAPRTCANFLDLVERGFYNGLIFHRVLDWVAQGGDPNGNGTGHFIDPDTGEPRYLRLEINRMLRHNAPGIVAMARENSPNSASCQFYIMKKPMNFLDGKYAVFGKVRAGLGNVYKIRPGTRILRMYVMGQPEEDTSAAPDFPISGSGRRAREDGDRQLEDNSGRDQRQSPPPAEKPDSGF